MCGYFTNVFALNSEHSNLNIYIYLNKYEKNIEENKKIESLNNKRITTFLETEYYELLKILHKNTKQTESYRPLMRKREKNVKGKKAEKTHQQIKINVMDFVLCDNNNNNNRKN